MNICWNNTIIPQYSQVSMFKWKKCKNVKNDVCKSFGTAMGASHNKFIVVLEWHTIRTLPKSVEGRDRPIVNYGKFPFPEYAFIFIDKQLATTSDLLYYITYHKGLMLCSNLLMTYSYITLISKNSSTHIDYTDEMF